MRSLVDFSHLNLLDPLGAKALCGFDLVFYRNVSIYFDADSRKTILNNLHGAMNDTGVLLLGVSETLANDLGIFRLVEEGGSFYFAKAAASPPPAVAPKRPPPKLRPPGKPEHHAVRPAVVPRPAAGADWASVIATMRALLRAKRYDEALRTIRALGASADPRLLLLEGHVRLHMRQFAEAAAIGERAVAADSWSCDAHMLLALAAKWQGDTAAAIRSLKVIVYAKPNCWPAHYYLATLLHDLDAAKARREYAAALRQIDADPDPDGGLWLPLDLPVADIRFLCEHHSAAAEASTPRQGQSGGP